MTTTPVSRIAIATSPTGMTGIDRPVSLNTVTPATPTKPPAALLVARASSTSNNVSPAVAGDASVKDRDGGSGSGRSVGVSARSANRNTSRTGRNEFVSADRKNPATVQVASRTGSGSNPEVAVGAQSNTKQVANAGGSGADATLAAAKTMLGKVDAILKAYLGDKFTQPANHAERFAAVTQVARSLKGSAKETFLKQMKAANVQEFGVNFGLAGLALSKADFAKLDDAHKAVYSSLFTGRQSNVTADPKSGTGQTGAGSGTNQTAAGQEKLSSERALQVAKELDKDGNGTITADEAKAIPAVGNMWKDLAPEGSLTQQALAEKLYNTVNQKTGTDAGTQPAGTQTLAQLKETIKGQTEAQTLDMVTAWDANKDDKISKEELNTASPEAAAKWDSFSNGQAAISIGDSVKLLRASTEPTKLTSESAKLVAKNLDADDDGKISTKEVQALPVVAALWSQWAPQGSMTLEAFAAKLLSLVNQQTQPGADASSPNSIQDPNKDIG